MWNVLIFICTFALNSKSMTHSICPIQIQRRRPDCVRVCIRICRRLLEDAHVKRFILWLLLLLLLMQLSATLFHSLFALYIQQTISTESKDLQWLKPYGAIGCGKNYAYYLKPIKTKTDTGWNEKNGMKVEIHIRFIYRMWIRKVNQYFAWCFTTTLHVHLP